MKLKKPKFWDYKQPNIYSYLLLPISLLIRFLKFFQFINKIKFKKIKTICVGNIYLGGTGKTSLSLKINNLLNQKKIKTCFIKKFYSNQFDEQEILKANGRLFLSSKRIDAIKQAETENYDVAIFDDGLQDKSIEYDVSFVCFNNLNWIGNGMTIPAGPLRESINNLKKYDHVFLNGNMENLDYLKSQIQNINPKINIYVARYIPKNLDEFNIEDKYIIFSGIGNHQTFLSMLKKNGFNIVMDIEFPDHYKYSERDINKILDQANNSDSKIITTEKDYFRLNNFNISKIKYIKSELEIIEEEKLIKAII